MRVYLDHNAGAPMNAFAHAAMLPWLVAGRGGNASSVHAEGRAARQAISDARVAVGAAIGIPATSVERCIVFTSGATEGNALVLHAARGPLVLMATSHPSVLLGRDGTPPARIAPVHSDGTLDLEQLEPLLRGAGLCSVIVANNETGVVQPLEPIRALCERAGVRLHVDAAQALGRLPLSGVMQHADYVTLSSHKIGGPVGAGALVAVSGAPLAALQAGHQERGRRGGTENVPAIVGFGAAVRSVPQRLDAMVGVARLRDRLWNGIRGMYPVWRNGVSVLPNTLNVGFEGLDGESLAISLDLSGVAVSTGAACSSGSVEASHVLLAMGLDEDAARSCLRFSLGPETTTDDIDLVLTRLETILLRQHETHSYLAPVAGRRAQDRS
ncbi:MAG: cysteine desulfurase [Myxococcales bacterium]|nr:cysteine desulfurase [Myxococcales bacterium]